MVLGRRNAAFAPIDHNACLWIPHCLAAFGRARCRPVAARQSSAFRADVGTKETFATALGQVRIFPDLEVVGLVAEEKQLQGFEIGRVRVIAEPANLSRLLGQAAIDVLLIADATIRSYPDAVSTAAHFGTEIRLLPSAANVMRGHVRVTAHLAPEKLFAKEHAKSPAHPKVLEVYRDRSVLITGAGGSIGSELCRQLCELGISRLLLLDNDENSIFEIHSDLLQAEMTVDVVPLVGDIRDQGRVKHVFTQHRPDIVLHSAAYKHVPVMETNASEAVLNNVIGTRNIADAALLVQNRAIRGALASRVSDLEMSLELEAA